MVWVFPTDLMAFDELSDALSAAERECAGRLREPARRTYQVAHATLRRLLGRHLGVPATAVPIEPSPCLHCGVLHGKPRLPREAGLEFNISHTASAVAIAVAAGRAVGVDVEGVERVRSPMDLAERWFSGPEVALVRACPPHERPRAFARLWARKEAYLKATGAGIAGVGPVLDTSADRVEGPAGVGPWRIWDVAAPAGCVAAVAAFGSKWRVHEADAASLLSLTPR